MFGVVYRKTFEMIRLSCRDVRRVDFRVGTEMEVNRKLLEHFKMKYRIIDMQAIYHEAARTETLVFLKD